MPQGETVRKLFPSGKSSLYPRLLEYSHPWCFIAELPLVIREVIKEIAAAGYVFEGSSFCEVSDGVLVASDSHVSESALLLAPTIVMPRAQVRHGAFLRGGVFVGRGCVVGNSSELKNTLLFDGAKTPHFNYVGDSVIGAGANLGAGAVVSNLRLDGAEISVRLSRKGELFNTGMRKLGALIGDGVGIGCGCVLNPGCVIGTGAMLSPLSSVRGYIPPFSRPTSDIRVTPKASAEGEVTE